MADEQPNNHVSDHSILSEVQRVECSEVVPDASTFVLDLASNPHPRMLAGALDARRRAFGPGRFLKDQAYWYGYLDAMADATGCAASDLEAWLDRHEGDA